MNISPVSFGKQMVGYTEIPSLKAGKEFEKVKVVEYSPENISDRREVGWLYKAPFEFDAGFYRNFVTHFEPSVEDRPRQSSSRFFGMETEQGYTVAVARKDADNSLYFKPNPMLNADYKVTEQMVKELKL